MNLENMQDQINAFTREVIDSGFKRDVDDYANSLPSVQGNIVSLRDIATKVTEHGMAEKVTETAANCQPQKWG